MFINKIKSFFESFESKKLNVNLLNYFIDTDKLNIFYGESGSINGWIFNPVREINSVVFEIDDHRYPAEYGFERYDVYEYYGMNPNALKSGFECKVSNICSGKKDIVLNIEYADGGKEKLVRRDFEVIVNNFAYSINNLNRTCYVGDVFEINGHFFSFKQNILNLYLKIGNEIFTTEYKIIKNDVYNRFMVENSFLSGFNSVIKLEKSGTHDISFILIYEDGTEDIIKTEYRCDCLSNVNGDFMFYLDNPLINEFEVGTNIKFSGWCFARNNYIKELFLINSNTRTKLEYGFERQDVQNCYRGYKQSLKSGFEGVLSFDDCGEYDISIGALLYNDDTKYIYNIKRIKINDFTKINKNLIEWLGNNSSKLNIKLDHINYIVDNKYEIYLKEDTGYYEQLIIPKIENPKVSIIIPVYNKFNYTYSCIKTIIKNTKDVEYEIILADDVSSDETKDVKKYVENIIISRNEKNLGFLLNCNEAAKKARGKYVLFLNNDTNVQKNWLSSLVDLLEKDNKIGMTGSKLVYPDGRLQEAGGIVWKDASAWNFGRLDDPEKSEYNYVREVDYISGAAIMIRKQLWEEIGGFDTRYVPAYCEDSDLAFEVRKHGYKVVYQPLSIVIHFEGVSHGTDVNSGIKKYQVDNNKKFYEKWKDVLNKENFENACEVFYARDKSFGKKTIVVIDHYVPTFDMDAGSRTTYQYLKMFVNKGYNVKFIGDNFAVIEPYTTALKQLGIEVLDGIYYYSNWKKWFIDNKERIDFVYCNRPHITEKYIDFLRKETKTKIIYYGHDLHFMREYRQFLIERNDNLLESSRRWKDKEFDIFRKSDVVYYPSIVEVNEIKKEMPELNVKAIVPYIFDKIKIDNDINFSMRNDIIFVGGFAHTPNIDAVLWFTEKIFPKILETQKDIKFYVIGSKPPEEIKNLASDSIIVTGYVSDEELEKHYSKCKLVVAPLRYGAGIKGKIVEAMSKGIPVVTTSIGAEGLIDCENILKISDDENEIANQVIKLYNNNDALKEIALKSIEYINSKFSIDAAYGIIKEDF